ncbi:hypothetical protein PR048_001257 [Dryococelus australis]|uniref:Uncharacterized protein n=1 Tax=Dryococelus australis TaxID=614101 RepID=A0ABQ9IGX8_9NEOP|nr:hypothetical protein PR048_001257 [Dryococelus australis]
MTAYLRSLVKMTVRTQEKLIEPCPRVSKSIKITLKNNTYPDLLDVFGKTDSAVLSLAACGEEAGSMTPFVLSTVACIHCVNSVFSSQHGKPTPSMSVAMGFLQRPRECAMELDSDMQNTSNHMAHLMHLPTTPTISYTVMEVGTTVAERLACLPPTKAIRVQSPAGPLLIFACGNRAGRCRWSAGILGGLSFPPPFYFGAAPYFTSVMEVFNLYIPLLWRLYGRTSAPPRRTRPQRRSAAKSTRKRAAGAVCKQTDPFCGEFPPSKWRRWPATFRNAALQSAFNNVFTSLQTSQCGTFHSARQPIRYKGPSNVLRCHTIEWFTCGNRAGRCRWSAGFLEGLPFPPPFHFGATPYPPQSPSSALKTSMLRVIQIYSLLQVVFGVVWTNRTMVSSNTDTNRTVSCHVSRDLTCLSKLTLVAATSTGRLFRQRDRRVLKQDHGRWSSRLAVHGQGLRRLGQDGAQSRHLSGLIYRRPDLTLIPPEFVFHNSGSAGRAVQRERCAPFQNLARRFAGTRSVSPFLPPRYSASNGQNISKQTGLVVRNFAYFQWPNGKRCRAVLRWAISGALFNMYGAVYWPVKGFPTTAFRKRCDGNIAHLARRSDEALGVRVNVALIAPLDAGFPRVSIPLAQESNEKCMEYGSNMMRSSIVGRGKPITSSAVLLPGGHQAIRSMSPISQFLMHHESTSINMLEVMYPTAAPPPPPPPPTPTPRGYAYGHHLKR